MVNLSFLIGNTDDFGVKVAPSEADRLARLIFLRRRGEEVAKLSSAAASVGVASAAAVAFMRSSEELARIAQIINLLQGRLGRLPEEHEVSRFLLNQGDGNGISDAHNSNGGFVDSQESSKTASVQQKLIAEDKRQDSYRNLRNQLSGGWDNMSALDKAKKRLRDRGETESYSNLLGEMGYDPVQKAKMNLRRHGETESYRNILGEMGYDPVQKAKMNLRRRGEPESYSNIRREMDKSRPVKKSSTDKALGSIVEGADEVVDIANKAASTGAKAGSKAMPGASEALEALRQLNRLRNAYKEKGLKGAVSQLMRSDALIGYLFCRDWPIIAGSWGISLIPAIIFGNYLLFHDLFASSSDLDFIEKILVIAADILIFFFVLGIFTLWTVVLCNIPVAKIFMGNICGGLSF